MRNLIYFLAIAYFFTGCAGTPKRPAHTTAVKSAPPISKEGGLPTETNFRRSGERVYSSKPVEVEPDITAEQLPTPPRDTEDTSEEKTPAGQPPDLGRKLPRLIYSEELEFYTSPSAVYDIYFDNGVWYVRSGSVWYRSKSHLGPWERVEDSGVPEVLR